MVEVSVRIGLLYLGRIACQGFLETISETHKNLIKRVLETHFRSRVVEVPVLRSEWLREGT